MIKVVNVRMDDMDIDCNGRPCFLLYIFIGVIKMIALNINVY